MRKDHQNSGPERNSASPCRESRGHHEHQAEEKPIQLRKVSARRVLVLILSFACRGFGRGVGRKRGEEATEQGKGGEAWPRDRRRERGSQQDIISRYFASPPFSSRRLVTPEKPFLRRVFRSKWQLGEGGFVGEAVESGSSRPEGDLGKSQLEEAGQGGFRVWGDRWSSREAWPPSLFPGAEHLPQRTQNTE